ncbi:MAG TPA: 1-phosphofructokinase family hexose kinase [Acetobacteraceae bacterium]|nr:1-phosphofructokinase family hexose kinase [Acetobacteraceae bacterium]
MTPRLITLTLNPALDIACTAKEVVHTHKIHTRDDHLDPGGGGINVARVLHEMGGDTLAAIMVGGVTGTLIEEMLDAAGVPRHTVPIGGRTRICFNVFESMTRLEYRFVQEGPDVSDSEWHCMLDALDRIPGGWLIASGSLEHGMPEDIYAQVARAAGRRGQRFVLDTSGPALRAALGSGIEMIKPSLGELEALAGRKLPERLEQEAEALALVRAGAARLVAVTLGEAGAFVASGEGVIRRAALRCEVRSAVGAGDSFTAAMTLALARGATLEDALAWGVAAGTAAVVCAGTARIRRVDVETQYQRLSEPVAG